MQQLFAISYAPGPGWLAGTHTIEQSLQPHLAYMTELTQRGILLLGGPFKQVMGGLGIIMAGSEDQARELVAQDPAVQAQLLSATVNPWKVVLTGALAFSSWCEAAARREEGLA